jgi:site-specific recombinase XerC
MPLPSGNSSTGASNEALQLEAIRPRSVAAYIEQLGAGMAKPLVKQHLAAIRQLFDYMVTGGILLSNPAGAVRGPKYVVKRGKTPVLSADQARQLLALIRVMVYNLRPRERRDNNARGGLFRTRQACLAPPA